MHVTVKLVVLVLALVVASCQPTRFTATLRPTHLKANDLEETFTRRDEALLAYALSAYDAQNRLLDTRNGAWGVERVKRGQTFGSERFVPLDLPVPKGGRLVATVALVEVEDYQRAQDLVGKIRQATGVAGGAATFLQLTEITNPIGYLLLSLQAAGIGLNLVQQFDADDVLGTDTFTLTPQQLRTGPRRYHRQLQFEGRHGGERYEYEIRYEMSVTR
jgi:hypothetical protein